MSKVDRRDFLKTTTAAAAAASLPLTEQAKAARPLVDIDQPIPPQRVELLYGLHAYTDQLSVEPGDEVQFHTTSTVPYQLSVCRLGEEVDDPNGDQVFVEYPESPPRLQPIRPGSYVHVEQGLAPEESFESINLSVLKFDTLNLVAGFIGATGAKLGKNGVLPLFFQFVNDAHDIGGFLFGNARQFDQAVKNLAIGEAYFKVFNSKVLESCNHRSDNLSIS